MDVHLIRSSEVGKELFTKVVDLLQAVSGPIRFRYDVESVVDFSEDLLEDRMIVDETEFGRKHFPMPSACMFEPSSRSFPLERREASWKILFQKSADYRKRHLIPEDQFVLLITNMPNENNWFAALDEKMPYNGFIHSDDWDFYIDCSAAFPVAYEVMALVLQKQVFNGMADLRNKVHSTAIGCVSDLCMNKREIVLKLRTADICRDCMTELKNKLPLNVIHHARSIMESLRVKMLFAQNFRQDQPLSRLIINKKKDIFLADFDNIQVRLRPLEKALYFLYLKYPDGIMLSNLCNHRQELCDIYVGISQRGMLKEMEERIGNMTNVLSNSASEKISRIRQAFEEAIGSDLAQYYCIKGDVGDAKKIILDRSLVEPIE